MSGAFVQEVKQLLRSRTKNASANTNTNMNTNAIASDVHYSCARKSSASVKKQSSSKGTTTCIGNDACNASASNPVLTILCRCGFTKQDARTSRVSSFANVLSTDY